MQSKFQEMSNSLMERIDDMGTRIDELEKCISDLLDQAQVSDASDAGKALTAGTQPGQGAGQA